MMHLHCFVQLAENSRTWGKERANLDLKLNEAEHGFGRSTGMVIHDYPVLVRYFFPIKCIVAKKSVTFILTKWPLCFL